MIKKQVLLSPALLLSMLLGMAPMLAIADQCPSFLDGELKRLHSQETINLCDEWQGEPMLIVNTASHCGLTPQFTALEAIHQRYKDKGLKVIGFPSGDFNQEAKTEAEAAEICFINYGVTFTMVSPVSVKGDAAHPVFKELARQSQEPGWNFTKYLVGGDGSVVAHFSPRVSPDSEEFTAAIEQLLTSAH